jgi:hypothetical protein
MWQPCLREHHCGGGGGDNGALLINHKRREHKKDTLNDRSNGKHLGNAQM